MALLKKSKNVLDANFIEGMVCVGGCIGGAGCLTHGEKNKSEVDKYGREEEPEPCRTCGLGGQEEYRKLQF